MGKPGDPVGLCKKCSSMSCGWHGARTPREFICIICDINGLLASAGWGKWEAEGGLDRLREQLGSGSRGAPSDDVHGDDAVALARALAALFSTADGDPGVGVVATLKQWFAERPHYDQFRSALDEAVAWAIGIINQWFGTMAAPGPGEGVRSLWNGLSEDGRRLLAAAVLLILALDLELDTLPPPVVDVAQQLGTRLRDYPDKISALQRQIRAQL